jgi:ubiquinone/menaquinone biosynthesis C-methylase UbiE
MTAHGPGPGDWTKRYFGKLYGELYSRHLLPPSQTRREAEFARHILELDGKRVLDLACGFGRHARIFSRHAWVVGLDHNHEYLARALATMPRRQVGRFSAIRGDMRRLPLRDASFDAVVLLFNSFGYFVQPPASPSLDVKRELWKLPQVFYERKLVSPEFGSYKTGDTPADVAKAAQAAPIAENELVLQEIGRVLISGGQLLLEAPNPRPLIEAVMSAPRRWLITKDFEIEEEFSYDRLRRVLSNVTRFTVGNRTEVADYYLRLYSRRELVAALRRAGFEVVQIFGSYEGEPYVASSSPCMLFYGRKQGQRRRSRKRSPLIRVR